LICRRQVLSVLYMEEVKLRPCPVWLNMQQKMMRKKSSWMMVNCMMFKHMIFNHMTFNYRALNYTKLIKTPLPYRTKTMLNTHQSRATLLALTQALTQTLTQTLTLNQTELHHD